jgi:hypothetical protein
LYFQTVEFTAVPIQEGSMKPTVKAGLVLGLAVEVWTFMVVVLEWHKDPVLLSLFYLVILIQAGVLVWGLRMTAAAGKTFGGQVAAGTAMSAVGAVIILVGSYLITTVLFPNYFAELEEAGRLALAAQGMSEAEVQARFDAMASMNTPFMNALMGAVMTVVTGVVLSLIIAIFVKGQPGQPSEGPSAA